MRLFRGNINPLKAGQTRRIKPFPIGKQRIPPKKRHGRFKMQASAHRHGRHGVSVVLDDQSQLTDAVFIRAF